MAAIDRRGHPLGDDVLEVGPGYGATDVFGASVPRLTSVEIGDIEVKTTEFGWAAVARAL